MTALAKMTAKLLGRNQIYYAAYQPSMDMYVQCAAQAARDGNQTHATANEFWYKSCDLPPSFTTWFQITQLHIWMIMVRMRAMDKDVGQHYQQQITNHFFNDAEARLRVVYMIKDGRIIQTYMKDLLLQWRGSNAAYDEALCKEDSVLAMALWRNMYGGGANTPLSCLASMAAYVRNNVAVLEQLTDQQVLHGKIDFEKPKLLAFGN